MLNFCLIFLRENKHCSIFALETIGGANVALCKRQI